MLATTDAVVGDKGKWKQLTFFSLNYQWKGSAFVAHYLEHKAGVRYLCLIATLETALVNYDRVYLMLRVRGWRNNCEKEFGGLLSSIQRGTFSFS